LGVRELPVEQLGPRLDPVDPIRLIGPEGAEALVRGGPGVDVRIVGSGVGYEGRGRREGALLTEEILDRGLEVLLAGVRVAVLVLTVSHGPILASGQNLTRTPDAANLSI